MGRVEDVFSSGPAEVQPPPEVMVQVKLAVPVRDAASVTVTVTFEVPLVVGLPEMRPVEELIDRPAGSPVADQV